MTETQTCPRRLNEPGPWEQKEDLDAWRDATDPVNPGPVCSFCGSLKPSRFLELVSEGWIVEPTMKSYKAYLGEVRYGEPGEPLPVVTRGRAKFYFQHLDEKQMQHFVDLYNTNVMQLGLPGFFETPPYFMQIGHPSPE